MGACDFWIAYDDAARGRIGSRYFTIANGERIIEPAPATEQAPGRSTGGAGVARVGFLDVPLFFGPVRVKTGYDLGRRIPAPAAGRDGIHRIDIPELNRVEIELGDEPAGSRKPAFRRAWRAPRAGGFSAI